MKCQCITEIGRYTKLGCLRKFVDFVQQLNNHLQTGKQFPSSLRCFDKKKIFKQSLNLLFEFFVQHLNLTRWKTSSPSATTCLLNMVHFTR